MRYHDRIVCDARRASGRKACRPPGHIFFFFFASELLLRLHGEERECICAFRYLQARARNFVSKQWPLIEDLAKGLLKSQSLTGKEIAGILQANRLVQVQEDRAPEA